MTRRRSSIGVPAALVAVVLVVGWGVTLKHAANDVTGELVILHAGSLSVPFREISKRFNERYPNVTIKAEAAGSRDTARKVSDLGRRCDVLGSADFQVIDNLLIPQHADFGIRFATNEMVIAYSDGSRYTDAIAKGNWPEVLLTDGVAFGRADPDRDPCGYRTLMVFQLAEKFYRIPNLARKLKEKDGFKYVRPKETDLLALLETGEIDFLVIYRSVAQQHGLSFIELPDEVNLRSTEFRADYARVTVEVTGRQPGSRITRTGAPIVYGVTIPKTCKNRAMADAWVRLLLSPIGQRIMEQSGQTPITPALTMQFDVLPAALEPLCTPTGETG